MGSNGLEGIRTGLNGFYWVLLGFTGFYWVLLGFTGFSVVRGRRQNERPAGKRREGSGGEVSSVVLLIERVLRGGFLWFGGSLGGGRLGWLRPIPVVPPN